MFAEEESDIWLVICRSPSSECASVACRGQLYAVVSMEPDDEVVNHVAPTERLNERHNSTPESSPDSSEGSEGPHEQGSRCETHLS